MDDTESHDAKPKRPKGDRGLFQRPKGVWWVCYFDDRGRRHREKVGPKGLAREVYEKRKTEIRERRFFPERIRRPEVTLHAMIDDYLTREKDRLRWMDHYKRYGDLWKAALGRKTLREILPGDVERCLARRRANGSSRVREGEKARRLAPASINRELAFLRRVFNVAIEDGKADANPVRAKMFAKENNQRVRYLTDAEEHRLREKLPAAAWPLVAISLNTGLRRAEQFGLRWEHVDFRAGC